MSEIQRGKDDFSRFKEGLALQRERFKAAKDGTGVNNFDQMADSIENLKSDLKSKIRKEGNIKLLSRVEAIINWYRTKEERHYVNTPEGPVIRFPMGMQNKINHNLNIAYELLVDQMDLLNLL